MSLSIKGLIRGAKASAKAVKSSYDSPCFQMFCDAKAELQKSSANKSW